MPRVTIPKGKTAGPIVEDLPAPPMPAEAAVDVVAEPVEPAAEDTPPLEISPDTARHVAEHRELERACDELFARAAEGHILTADERGLLKRLCPDSSKPIRFERWLEKQIQRVKTIREMQAVAGTPADREAAAGRLADAEQQRATEGQQIEAELARLRQRLSALDGAVATARADVDRRERALSGLREKHLLPQHIQEELRVLRQSTAKERSEFERCQNRVRAINVICGWNPAGADREKAMEHVFNAYTPLGVRLLDQCFPLRDGVHEPGNANPRVFRQAGWDQYLQTLRAEMAECLDTMSRLESVNARVAREAALLRDHWIPR